MFYDIAHINQKYLYEMSEIKQKRNSVYVVMAILLITKILGFLKLRVIAQLFGTSHELDIFWAAFTIPDTLFMITVAGSLNAAIIPLLADIFHKEGEEKLHKFFSKLVIVVGILILGLSILLIIFTPQIAQLLVTSEKAQTFLSMSSRLTMEDIELFVKLTRILLISPILLGLSSIFTGYLQVRRQFFITSLAPLFYDIAMIVGSIILVSVFNMGVTGIAIASVLGSFLHLGIQIPSLRKYFNLKGKGFGGNILLAFRDTRIWQALRTAFPRIIAILGEQINVIVNTIISFTLAPGALSAYKFALSLHMFPVNIVGSAMAQVALPDLAENCDNEKEFTKLFNRSIQQALYYVLPVVAILMILRLPIVRLVYGVGKFDWTDTILTSWSLGLLGVSIVAQTLAQIVLRAYYALKETWLPLIPVAIGILINIVLAYYLTNFFSHYYDWRAIIIEMGTQITHANGGGLMEVLKSFFGDFARWCTTRGTSDMAVGGLSLSMSIASFIEIILLFVFLNRKIKVSTNKNTIKPILTKVINTALMMLGMYLMFKLFDFRLDTSRTWAVIVLTAVVSLYGILSYWLGSKVFGIKEVDIFEEKIKYGWNKVFRKT